MQSHCVADSVAEAESRRTGQVDAPAAAEIILAPPPPASAEGRWALGQLYRTLAPLRWSQLGYLALRCVLWRRMRPVPWKVPVRLRPAPPGLRFPERPPAFAPGAYCTGDFCFIHNAFRAKAPISWNDPQCPKLRLYHLNYFDFLNVRFALPEEESMLRAALDIALNWRERNSTGTEVGWEPYPLSLRIVNWLKFLVRYGRDLEQRGEGRKIDLLLPSLAQQAATLNRRLEKDLLGNHLLKNIKALLFAGALLETPRSARWLEEGESLLERELKEQILPDGGHFERSPMYHAEVLEDLLDLQVLGSACAMKWRCDGALALAITMMRAFLQGILHPDGELPLLNDSALNVARPPAELLRAAPGAVSKSCDPRPAVEIFPRTGYGVIRDRASASHLVFDCGPLGPDCQPGHGHCDVLSYELSLHGRRVVVDTGVSTYERNAVRRYERSTAAHNTIRIDGEDQAEVWASFRVGRRPHVGALEGGSTGPLHFLRGEHYAYRRRGVVHARAIALLPPGAWVVVDLLKGRGMHRSESFIHLHPLVRVRTAGPQRFALCNPGEDPGAAQQTLHCWNVDFDHHTYSLLTYGAGEFSLLESWYSEEFGKRQGARALRWTWEGSVPVAMVYAFVPQGVRAPRVAVDAQRESVEIDGHPIRFVEKGH